MGSIGDHDMVKSRRQSTYIYRCTMYNLLTKNFAAL